MNAIGNIIGVSTQNIIRWITMCYDKFIPQNEIETKLDEIEIDEMYSYINKKIQSGFGRLLIITLEGFSAGGDDRSSKTLMGLFDDCNLWQARRVYTDNYGCYAEIVRAKQLRQGKKMPTKLDRTMHCNDTGWDVFADGRKLSPGLWIC